MASSIPANATGGRSSVESIRPRAGPAAVGQGRYRARPAPGQPGPSGRRASATPSCRGRGPRTHRRGLLFAGPLRRQLAAQARAAIRCILPCGGRRAQPALAARVLIRPGLAPVRTHIGARHPCHRVNRRHRRPYCPDGGGCHPGAVTRLRPVARVAGAACMATLDGRRAAPRPRADARGGAGRRRDRAGDRAFVLGAWPVHHGRAPPCRTNARL